MVFHQQDESTFFQSMVHVQWMSIYAHFMIYSLQYAIIRKQSTSNTIDDRIKVVRAIFSNFVGPIAY